MIYDIGYKTFIKFQFIGITHDDKFMLVNNAKTIRFEKNLSSKQSNFIISHKILNLKDKINLL